MGTVLIFSELHKHAPWLALISFLTLTIHPSPAWPEKRSLESVSFRLAEKPVEFTDEVSSEENSPSGPDFRFGSSDFTKERNLTLWQNVLTQELAHRFGNFLTSAAGTLRNTIE